MSDGNFLKGIGPQIIAAVEVERDRRFQAMIQRKERLKRLEGDEQIGEYFRLRSVLEGEVVRVLLNENELGTVALHDDDEYEMRATADTACEIEFSEGDVRARIALWAKDEIVSRGEQAGTKPKAASYADIAAQFRQ